MGDGLEGRHPVGDGAADAQVLEGRLDGRLRRPDDGNGGRVRAGLGDAGPALAVGLGLAVCGWHYARVWHHFGTPLVGNWSAASGMAWWQDPGYRVAGDYLSFGGPLYAPAYAGYHGVWDGLYSTLWGDGLQGGKSAL